MSATHMSAKCGPWRTSVFLEVYKCATLADIVADIVADITVPAGRFSGIPLVDH